VFIGLLAMSDDDAETLAVNAGRAEGRIHGESEGIHEGVRLGNAEGRKLGEELGAIKGLCLAWRHIASLDENALSDRAMKSLASLEALVDAFPRKNDNPQQDFMRDITLIRTKRKVVYSLLGMDKQPQQLESLMF